MKMPYPRLYLRMALHIGAALAAFVLIGAASLGLIAAWELQSYIETRQSSLGLQAARILAEGGDKALINWLETEAEIPPDVSVYILDSQGRDLMDRQIPGQYTEFIMNSVIGVAESPDSIYRPVRLAPQLISPDGEVLAFLVLPKSISLWGSPATLLGLLTVALLVVASVAWLIARTFSRPIGKLQIAVRELASGNTHARAPDSIAARGDELGSLAADFNSMAERLTGLIEGRENLFREMSHELRSPLARLQAAIALAAEGNSLNTKERERIEDEIGRMNQVIGEMLHYSSLDAGTATRRLLVRIDRILKELVQIEEIEAQRSGCQIELNTETDLLTIGDPGLLQSGFENILRNAIRYAPDGSIIEVSAKQVRGNGSRKNYRDIVIEISDRGPGVAEAHLDKIFEPYFRIGGNNHKQDSTGLGLAIVRRVFEQHAGTVSARKRHKGGLTITVTIPAADTN